MEKGQQFEGYDESKDWELDFPNPSRRYTVITHHGDRANPEVRRRHFNTFEQAKAYGNSLAWSDDILPNPDMHYTEKDGYSAAIWGPDDRSHSNKWGVILHTTKDKGRWRPYRDGYDAP